MSSLPNFKAKSIAGFAFALGCLGFSVPSESLASGMQTGTAYYRLTSTANIAAPPTNSTSPQVIATVLPPGAIVPPTQADGTQISPLTVLNTSTGFDPNQLIVALKDNAANAATGTPASQLFGLSFFGSGFTAANGHLDFALSVDSSLKSPPVLVSSTPGVTIASIPDPTNPNPPSALSGSGGSSPPNVSTPEPLSVTLWSVVVAIGVVHARRARLKVAVV